MQTKLNEVLNMIRRIMASIPRFVVPHASTIIVSSAVFMLLILIIVAFYYTSYPNVSNGQSAEDQRQFWMRKAAQEEGLNDPVSFCESRETEDDLIPCLEEFGKHGNVLASAHLGELYYLGERVSQDFDAAYNWLKRAAEQGHPVSQLYLGWMYDSGKGVSSDLDEAIKWYERAARQGISSAHWNLGITYENGPPERRSQKRAFSHYSEAGALGESAAFLKIGSWSLSGRGTKRDIPAAMYWLEKAAYAGYHDAMRLLSLIYFEGLQSSSDLVEAYKWALLYRRFTTSELSRRQAESALDLIRSRLSAQELVDARTRAVNWDERPPDRVMFPPPGSVSSPGDSNQGGDTRGSVDTRGIPERSEHESQIRDKDGQTELAPDVSTEVY